MKAREPEQLRDGGPSPETPGKGSSAGGRFLRDPVFWARMALGAVFILASLDKIAHPTAFARIIANYRIAPDALVGLIGLALPWLELLVGALLLSGRWLPGAVLTGSLLLALFFGALAFNALRGVDVHCGCFSTRPIGKPDAAWHLVRDGALLLLAAYLFHKTFRSAGPPDSG